MHDCLVTMPTLLARDLGRPGANRPISPWFTCQSTIPDVCEMARRDPSSDITPDLSSCATLVFTSTYAIEGAHHVPQPSGAPSRAGVW